MKQTSRNALPSTLDTSADELNPAPSSAASIVPPSRIPKFPVKDIHIADSANSETASSDKKAASYFLDDQSWEGMVQEVYEDSFLARLVDTKDKSKVEEAKIFKSALTDKDDLDLITPGAIFYWIIGNRVTGRRAEYVSLIMFRRLPTWTKREVAEAYKNAKKIREELGWD